ncbi:ClbS/DfsB family four-helix bundle protein [Lacticaseibacillus thailandensis]|uniref:ClbS/DfsB family four-helix bundle protein n=1 Tax=Lacticaseibacillus thailandensis DSM 22698 = JCM 13996 TaxID=1423810 RepID=A0A0R2CBJ7_9LACO|nr:ClbS/DfsB family four-helix bundle protein [Lacticaseibacillus thailandensis]KRM87396.1 hypothetical protein FD19_GL000898 [Lacticaseibacillus thailandensis DSM 22698 = JCM 13996]
MAKPESRKELLVAARTEYDKIWNLINSLPEQGATGEFNFNIPERNVRDVLVHLSTWQQMYLKWSNSNLDGHHVRFLPRPYTWQDYAALNQHILAEHQDDTLADAKTALEESHAKVIQQIEDLINEQLFIPGFYKWTGSTDLGAYATAITYGNYVWAVKILRLFKRQKRATTQA